MDNSIFTRLTELKTKTIMKLDYKDFEKAKKYLVGEAFNDSSGIYFLMFGEYVSYVGMTKKSVLDRINGSFGKDGHIVNKSFDSFKFIAMDADKETIETNEYYFINMFNPYFNIARKNGSFIQDLPVSYILKSENDKRNLNDGIMKLQREKAKQIASYW